MATSDRIRTEQCAVKILFWARVDFGRDAVVEAMRSVPGVEVTVVSGLDDAIDRIPGHDMIVLTDPHDAESAQRIAEAMGAPGSRARHLHFISAGQDSFSAIALPETITVTGSSGAVAPAVAEHAMALALAVARRVPHLIDVQRTGVWDQSPSRGIISLEGGTALVIGIGPIGREFSKRARAFGMRIIGLTRKRRDDAAFDDVRGLQELRTVLPEANLVVLAIALAPETEYLIGATEFRLMKPESILVNVGRGKLVDQAAMRDALSKGQIAGAAVDVTDPEPLPQGNPLWDAPNLIISCHMSAAGSAKSQIRLASIAKIALETLLDEMEQTGQTASREL